jgi:hypothetical protein
VSQQINLYNPALGPQRSLVSAQNLAIATLTVIVMVGVLGGLAETRRSAHKVEAAQASEQMKQVQDRLQQLVQQASNSKPDPALQSEVDRLTTLIDSRNTVLSVLEKGTSVAGNGYAEILRGLARQAVTGLWLTDISVTAQSNELELKGRTTDRTLVANYLGRLNGENIFAGRSFSGLRIEVPKAEDGSPIRSPAYLEFALMGSQDKALVPGMLGEGGGIEEKTKTVPDGKEKKS